MAIFWDNCPIHTARDVEHYLVERKIPQVTNVAYQPWWNGIEKVWAVAKKEFRTQLTKCKAAGQPIFIPNLVPEILQAIPKEIIKSCATHGWSALFKNTNVHTFQT